MCRYRANCSLLFGEGKARGRGMSEPYMPMFWVGEGRDIYAYVLGGGRERHICLCFVVSVRVRVLVNF